jgi:hypothetical protein
MSLKKKRSKKLIFLWIVVGLHSIAFLLDTPYTDEWWIDNNYKMDKWAPIFSVAFCLYCVIGIIRRWGFIVPCCLGGFFFAYFWYPNLLHSHYRIALETHFMIQLTFSFLGTFIGFCIDMPLFEEKKPNSHSVK